MVPRVERQGPLMIDGIRQCRRADVAWVPIELNCCGRRRRVEEEMERNLELASGNRQTQLVGRQETQPRQRRRMRRGGMGMVIRREKEGRVKSKSYMVLDD